MTDPAEQLARYVAETAFAEISLAAIERAKLALVDIIACAIGAVGSEQAQAVRSLAVHWGGRSESTVIGHDARLPSPSAAQVNATTARVLDFDDTYELAPGGGHASAYIVPTALAVAEAEECTDGRELLSAIAIAQDIYCRLAQSVRANSIDTGRDNIFSVFGSAVATARLLRLDRERTVNALGIAYAEAAGEMQMYEAGSHTVALQQGFRARSGLSAGYLARVGLKGPREVFLGRYGFYRVFEPDYDLGALLDELGTNFIGARLSFKSYPCCKCIHPALDAILHLRTVHDLRADQVTKLQIGTNRLSYDFVAAPAEQKWNPRSAVEARFSLPYAAAVALVKGAVAAEDFTEAAIENPEIRRVMERTEVSIDPEIERTAGHVANAPATVIIDLGEARTLRQKIDKPRGHPDNPATFDDGSTKLCKCIAFGGLAGAIDADRIVGSIAELERATDLRLLFASLVPSVTLRRAV